MHAAQIEAILFYKNEPVHIADLASLLQISLDETRAAIAALEQILSERGITLVSHKDMYTLATHKNFSALIEKITKEELQKDLSPASLETLSIVCYKGPITRKEIEYIRGVNASISLRTLLIRGLIERTASKLDERVYLYTPTTETLAYLGIKSIQDLPQYKEVIAHLHVPNT